MSSNNETNSKIILVTGASRGIGREILKSFISDPNYNNSIIIGTATSEIGLKSIDKIFSESDNHEKKISIQMDIKDQNSIEHALSVINNNVGSPDILINNAGITQDNLLLRMKDEQWQDVIDTNLTGNYRLIKACLRSMLKKRWGRIISISSVIAATGNAGQTNYAAAKAGLIGFSKSLAREVGSRGITVNIVSPGFIKTDMTKDLPDEQQRKLAEQIPVGRMGESQEVAFAVKFLAANEAAYITGETIHVNGGMLMQ